MTIQLPDAWLTGDPPTPERMAKEAGYAPQSATERAFCKGVDTERLRNRACHERLHRRAQRLEGIDARPNLEEARRNALDMLGKSLCEADDRIAKIRRELAEALIGEINTRPGYCVERVRAILEEIP